MHRKAHVPYKVVPYCMFTCVYSCVYSMTIPLNTKDDIDDLWFLEVDRSTCLNVGYLSVAGYY